MDDKILFYIILGVIYFLFNRLKKKPVQESEEQIPERPNEGPKPISFEDLLKEISESKNPPKPANQPTKPEYAEETYSPYVDYDDELEEENKSLETAPVYEDDRIVKAYEDAKQLAFNRPSLEETTKIESVDTRFSKFKSFETKEKDRYLSELLNDLRQPKGLKKALVVSEIINRKHF